MVNQTNQVVVNGKKPNGLFWKSMLAGALVGGGVSLFNSSVRRQMSQTMKNTKNTTMNLARQVKNEPRQTMQKIQNQINDIKNIASQVSLEAKDVSRKFDVVRNNSMRTYASMVEMGSEIGDIRDVIKYRRVNPPPQSQIILPEQQLLLPENTNPQ